MANPKLIEIVPGQWIQPNHVVGVYMEEDLVVIRMIDGFSLCVQKYQGENIIYRDADAVVSVINGEINDTNQGG